MARTLYPPCDRAALEALKKRAPEVLLLIKTMEENAEKYVIEAKKRGMSNAEIFEHSSHIRIDLNTLRSLLT